MNQIKLYKKIYNFMNILTAIAGILLFFCFCYSFDAENNYLIDSALTWIFYAVYIIGAIVSFASLLTQSEFEVITTPNGIHGRAKSYYTATNVASILTGAIGFFMTHQPQVVKSIFGAAAGLVAFGVFQLMLTSKSGYKSKTFKLILLFASVSLPVSLIFANLSDYNHHINSIENTLTVFFAVSFMLYILYEAKRIAYGFHSGWHFTSMLLTFMSGIVISSAYLFAFLFDIIKDGSRFYPMLMIMAVSGFIGVELKHFMYTARATSSEEFKIKKSEKLTTKHQEENATDTPNNQ